MHKNQKLERVNASSVMCQRLYSRFAGKYLFDPLTYLAYQSSSDIDSDFADLSRQDQKEIYAAKRKLLNERAQLVNNFTQSQDTSARRGNSNSHSHGFHTTSIADNPLFISSSANVGGVSSWCIEGNIKTIRFFSPDKDDLLCVIDNYFFAIAPYGSSSFLESRLFELSSPVGLSFFSRPLIDQLFVGDFNGDGIDEIGVASPAGFAVYQYTKTQSLVTGRDGMWVTNYYQNLDTWCSDVASSYSIKDYGIRVGDINGDKKDDMWCHRPNGSDDLRFGVDGSVANWNSSIPMSFYANSWCLDGKIKVSNFGRKIASVAMCVKSNFPGLSIVSYDQGKDQFESVDIDITPVLNLGYQDFNFNWVETGDFNADLKPDIWYKGSKYDTTNGLVSQSALFTIDGASLVKIDNNRLNSWCTMPLVFNQTTNDKMVVGDFNGDSRSDMFCASVVGGRNSVMLSKIPSPVFGRIDARISDFKVPPIFLKNVPSYTSVTSAVCNNDVRPDDKLKCEISSGLKLRTIDKITNINPLADQVQISFADDLYIPIYNCTPPCNPSYTKLVQLTQSGSDSQSIREESLTSTASTDVKSGECIRISMVTRYLKSLVLPYQAKINLLNISALPLSRSDMLLIANQLTDNPLSVKYESDGMFVVNGEITLNLMLDTNVIANNDCDVQTLVEGAQPTSAPTPSPMQSSSPTPTPSQASPTPSSTSTAAPTSSPAQSDSATPTPQTSGPTPSPMPSSSAAPTPTPGGTGGGQSGLMKLYAEPVLFGTSGNVFAQDKYLVTFFLSLSANGISISPTAYFYARNTLDTNTCSGGNVDTHNEASLALGTCPGLEGLLSDLVFSCYKGSISLPGLNMTSFVGKSFLDIISGNNTIANPQVLVTSLVNAIKASKDGQGVVGSIVIANDNTNEAFLILTTAQSEPKGVMSVSKASDVLPFSLQSSGDSKKLSCSQDILNTTPDCGVAAFRLGIAGQNNVCIDNNPVFSNNIIYFGGNSVSENTGSGGGGCTQSTLSQYASPRAMYVSLPLFSNGFYADDNTKALFKVGYLSITSDPHQPTFQCMFSSGNSENYGGYALLLNSTSCANHQEINPSQKIASFVMSNCANINPPAGVIFHCMTFNTAQTLGFPFNSMTSFANTSITEILRQGVDGSVSDATLLSSFLSFASCPASNQKCELWCVANQVGSTHRALCLQTQGDLVDPIPTPYLLGGNPPSGVSSTQGGYNNMIHRLQFNINTEQPCFTGDTTSQNVCIEYVTN